MTKPQTPVVDLRHAGPDNEVDRRDKEARQFIVVRRGNGDLVEISGLGLALSALVVLVLAGLTAFGALPF